MGGDIVESGISTEQFNLFFKAAEPVFSKIPLFAANGNHESNFIGGKPELYLDEFVFPCRYHYSTTSSFVRILTMK